ncbi:hypothetical protein CCE02nite_18370 [Cellulosimicrobium cellulans]|uniref:Uncharacterized protein n=1 Tax=Cellulosimicrobium cellulans TaxID=1710 RepID=A0A4Y4E2T2_CELCE|nr:hypothetical protein CCE02nite_18370 [Cellulosimicrobium cellulans]
MSARLDRSPAETNREATHNGVTRPVLMVLMMILRQAARDGVIPATPEVSIAKQRHPRRRRLTRARPL